MFLTLGVSTLFLQRTMKIDVSPHVEEVGLDITQIGEQA